ncbi:YceI family protein [Paenibacillus prosopidis]|uniref:Polyisoprenoid-binding protein YceI n=1 Tax=Paenibacillus prosopidis TaxID=630520 RepID=A0A368VR33_9BACL|nr:YceI family protein [Paenibacillus prosopidis]RCW44370.1 polyisoprenoid-binding protein YceI [Paenibacillus prosopidis]
MKIGKVKAMIAAAVIVLGFGAYWMYEEMTGNHVEIESVINQSPAEETSAEVAEEVSADASEEADADAGNAGEAASIDGLWNISSDSKVYFSVTTSKETVNYEVSQVTGSWTVNGADPAQNQAEGVVQMASMDSGNSQRDGHISGAQYLDIEQFPTATFKATSFEGLPSEWTDGQIYTVNIKGDLTVKGVTKEVAFTGQTTYDGGLLMLEASTVVTFADFGMKSPHNIVMDSENNLNVTLRLVLNK